jgi:calcineurin-like phosphoesterase family protein
MIYFTSDTHWGHANIIKYCNRPYDTIEEMDAALIKRWNDLVTDKDTVFHLGDIAMGDIKTAKRNLEELRGRIYYLTGNHFHPGYVPARWQKLGGTGGFWEILPSQSDSPVNITLNHYAQRTWNKAHKGAIHLFGHTHGALEPLGKSVDVGVDSPWITGKPEYRPFSLAEILKWAASQPELGHHNREGKTIDT